MIPESEKQRAAESLKEIQQEVAENEKRSGWKRRLKNALWILGGTLAVLLVVAYLFNYQILLTVHGLSPDSTAIIHVGMDENGNEYRIVGNDKDRCHTALGVVKKDVLGGWHLSGNVVRLENKPSGRIYVYGFDYMGYQRTAEEGPIQKVGERHLIYVGNNAVRRIWFVEGQFPEGVSVTVVQNDQLYTIKVTHSTNHLDYWFDYIDLDQLLKENGFVQ